MWAKPSLEDSPLHSLAQNQFLVITMEERVDVGVASSSRAEASMGNHLNIGDENVFKLLDNQLTD